MELINRKIKLAIEAVLSYFQVITITGPRQSGKTTLCQNLFSDLPYINLEDAVPPYSTCCLFLSKNWAKWQAD
jgi:predicted AAA+ superfamily ATPase